MATTNKSTRAPTFGEASKPFTDAGIAPSELLPIAPFDAEVADSFRHAKENGSLGKAPGRHIPGTGKWAGLQGPHLTKGLAETVQREAQSWPTGNVGVLCRSFPAVDADVGSERARRVVERAVVAVFGLGYAERIRGDGPRRLYALRSRPDLEPAHQVPNEKWAFQLPGDDMLHGVDILGHKKQFVAAGTHPTGDTYGWREGSDLCAMVQAGEIEWIERTDIDNLRAQFEEEVRKEGGTVVLMAGGNGGGASKGTGRDYSWDAPAKDPKRLMSALRKMPNTRANFPDRDSFISVIAGFRATAGCEADNFEEDMREWAANGEPGFGYEGAEFNRIWRSTRYPRVTRDYLLLLLRRHGVQDFAGDDFSEDADAQSTVIAGYRATGEDEKAAKNAPLLERASRAYVFQHTGAATGAASRNIRYPMRLRARPDRVWSGTDWWAKLLPDPDPQLLRDLHIAYGEKKTDLPDFLRDLEEAHPFAFFTREIRHPGYDYGAVAERYDTSGNPDGALNVRQRSQAQNAAAKPRRNLDLAKADREHFLDFMRRGFGDGQNSNYILDSLAYMVQTGERPGHMLVIEGEPGVGKSLFAEMLIALFDGTGPHVRSRISGAKLMDENAMRFAFGQSEGCRIISVKELPDGSGRAKTAALISTLKEMVDAGSGGEHIEVERKGVDSRSVENFAYIIATTNYENVIPIEDGDRRIMPVRFRITQANRPDQEFYVRLGAILKDPERLAAIWDHLSGRAIRHYRADAPPPVTAEKAAAQYRNMADQMRHMAAALDTLAHAGRTVVTLADIVPLANWVVGAEARERGDWDGGGDPYTVGKPVGTAASGGATPMRGKALDYLGEKTRKVDPRKHHGRQTPTVYVLGGSKMPVEDMPWPQRRDLLERDRERHPVREGVQVKPYDRQIEPMAPVVDRIAGEDEDDADRAETGNVVPMEGRRRRAG